VAGPDQDRGGPPADPEEWTDEQWLEWLKATDAEPADPSEQSTSGPVTAMGRITHSPEGQVLGRAMLGLAYAMYGRQDDEVVVVAEGSGEPGDDGPVTLELDDEHPERSRAILRPPRADEESGQPGATS
jgi:hypothetical protein